MAKTVSLMNVRGGVGRSLLGVTLGHQFASQARSHRDVLVVDLDPHSAASQYALGRDRYVRDIVGAHHPTIADILQQPTHTSESAAPALDPTNVIVNMASYGPSRARLDLVPSHADLVTLTHPHADMAARFKGFIALVRDRYDLILIDCSVSVTPSMSLAYALSDFILVPAIPTDGPLDIRYLGQSFGTLRRPGEPRDVTVAGVIFNHARPDAQSMLATNDEVRHEAAQLGWPVFRSEVGYSSRYAELARDGASFVDLHDGQRMGPSAVQALANEIAGAIGL